MAGARVIGGGGANEGGKTMNRGVVLGVLVALAAPAAGLGQTSLERGRYLVDTVMTCHNCHTPMGPNGPQFDRALSGGYDLYPGGGVR